MGVALIGGAVSLLVIAGLAAATGAAVGEGLLKNRPRIFGFGVADGAGTGVVAAVVGAASDAAAFLWLFPVAVAAGDAAGDEAAVAEDSAFL